MVNEVTKYNQRVKNKIAVVTGASRGLGASSAELLAQHGATVILTDILDQEGSKLSNDLNQKGYKSEYYHLDVSSEDNWRQLATDLKQKYDSIDILFNNAGVTGFHIDLGPQDPEHASLDSWHLVHQINLDGVFLGCKYGISLMKDNLKNKTSGQFCSIINMSSRSGVVGIPTAAAYASSKAAVRNHTKSVALYCAAQGYNIRCNSIHPAAILTPLWDEMLGTDPSKRNETLRQIELGIPLGKMGEPIDVAYMVLYLASDESQYVTGSEFTIDGGILAGSAASYKAQNMN